MLQHSVSTTVTQQQVLTPALMQFVGLLPLNNVELKELIEKELVDNPVLEQIDETYDTLNQQLGREGDRERSAEELLGDKKQRTADSFEPVDLGSHFSEYLDPGFRTMSVFEEYESIAADSFLAQPVTLSDHLTSQLATINVSSDERGALKLLVGNLDGNGYLQATQEELLALGEGTLWTCSEQGGKVLDRARHLLQQLDPVGIGACDLQECLLLQIAAHQASVLGIGERGVRGEMQRWSLAEVIVRDHLHLLQKQDLGYLTRVCRAPREQVEDAIVAIRDLEPRPGQRFHPVSPRFIEPDISLARRGDQWSVVMQNEGLPSLRISAAYRSLLRSKNTERDVRNYVKERYHSAIQLLRCLEQRKSTIIGVCEAIVRRQQAFLEIGVQGLVPMMMKEVADEVGVHPSTVSRAVANKYVITPQGVYELRFFFTEAVNGVTLGGLSLPVLKGKVKELLQQEDPAKPLTDAALVIALEKQGIHISRRSVAKYRDEMCIPSTHERRRAKGMNPARVHFRQKLAPVATGG